MGCNVCDDVGKFGDEGDGEGDVLGEGGKPGGGRGNCKTPFCRERDGSEDEGDGDE